MYQVTRTKQSVDVLTVSAPNGIYDEFVITMGDSLILLTAEEVSALRIALNNITNKKTVTVKVAPARR